ncbi:MAG TPA: MOSC domain-containing protein [Planctomycetota bacterium]|nr:MOSC domain-containing protein [Planctomycetota bacterium]
MGVVVSIHRVQVKHGPAEKLAEARYITDFGLENDWRSRKGRGRQITLIEEEALEFVARTLKMDAIPEGASRRQIVVRGIRLNDTVGKKLRVGPLLIQVDELCDPCKNMEKTIGKGAWWAMESRGGIVGKVLEGGVLKAGDCVQIEDEPAQHRSAQVKQPVKSRKG